MKSMLYMSLFWKIHRDYKENIRIQKEKEIEVKELLEKENLINSYNTQKCKDQYKIYLKYLETKNVKINNYVSIENLLIN